MTHLSDETLMLYADGLLDPMESADVEKLLADDPMLRARLKIFSATGHRLALLFEDHVNSPLPSSLRAVVSYEEGNIKRSKPCQRPLRLRILDQVENLTAPGHHSSFKLALASSAALIVGLGLGWMVHDDEPKTASTSSEFIQVANDGVIARGSLRHMLDSSPSGKETKLETGKHDDLRLTVKLSFKNHDQNYCREYEIAGEASEHYAGIACRIGGEWRINMHAMVASSRGAFEGAGPAGGDQSHAVIEAAVIAQMEGESLGREDEAALIQKGWEK